MCHCHSNPTHSVGLVALEDAARATHSATRELGEERHRFRFVNELDKEGMQIRLLPDALDIPDGHRNTFPPQTVRQDILIQFLLADIPFLLKGILGLGDVDLQVKDLVLRMMLVL